MESQNSSVTCNKDARMDSKIEIKEEPWLLQEDLAEVKSELNGSPFVKCEVENKIVPFESHFIAETVVHSDHLETVIKVETKEEPSWIENGSTEPKLESEEAPILADDFQNEEKDSASWKIGMCENFSRPESPRLHTEAVCNNDSNTPTLIIGTLKDEQCLKVTEEDYDDKRDDACKDHVKGETKKLLIVTSAFSLRLHKCEVCGKTFSHASNLKQHNLIHEGIKPYKCEICEKSYTRISYLNVHKLSHEDNRPYKCEVCGKTFTLSSYLKMHSVSHESKKTHKCEVCEKRFMFLFELEKHSLTHKGRKLHKCKFCDRSFTRASHLKGHILIHEGIRPYECEICKKSFTVMSNLKIHNMIHENERPYKCKVCNKGFIQLSHLKRHNLIHEGEKPYKCEICDKGFVQLSHLRRHNLIHET